MDSLRMRLLVVGQRSSDILQRLEQALEVSSHLDPAQEGLALWLEHMEKEQSVPGSQPGEGPCPLAPSDRDKLEQGLRSELAAVSQLSSRLEELSQVHLNIQATRLALAEQKRLSAESLHHQGVVEKLVEITGPLLSFCPADIQKRFQPLVQPLRERTECLGPQSSACALQLEQAQLLLAQHAEAQAELGPWLEEAQRVAEECSPGSIGCEAFRKQQEVLQGLREAIAEHGPLMAKLQRVTAQLAELCPQEAAPLWQGLQAAEERYASLREHVQQAAAVLGEAVPRYSRLSERMELMAGCLERVQERVRHLPALRGDPIWLQEQLWESSLRLAELEKLGVALETLRGQGAELLATLRTTTHPAVQERVQELQRQWQALWEQEEEREASLQELSALAGRFWPGLADLAGALSSAQRMVLDLQETAASDPKDIQAQLVAMQALREEADSLQSELDSLGAWGMELLSLCGDLEKPTITKSLDDLYSSWNSLNKMWEERQNHLEDQLQALVTYQETMEGLLAWLEEAEQRMAEEFRGGGDLAQVERELSELKAFKRDLYQRQVEAESLWHQSSHRGAAQEDTPLAFSGFRDRWTQLEEELVTRQHQLEATLLGLGQFQSQLEWLLQWLQDTVEQLQGPAPLTPDLQSCEIELAKHQVLRKDVVSHTLTVRSVQEAGRSLQLPGGGHGGSVEGLQGSLQQLGCRWSQVLAEMERRQRDLEHNLSQVQEITLEITRLMQWLDRVELQLSSSKPIWGPLEATKDRLAAHLELCEEMDAKQQTYQQVQEKGQHLLATCHPNRASSTEHSLTVLEQKWGSIASRVQEMKEQLLRSLNMATELRATVQELLQWIGQTEEVLAALPPPSYILDTVSKQRQQQQALAKETETRSKKLAGMEAMAARLKQDDRTPPSLVGTAKERLAKVLQQVSERGEVLEEAHHQAKQFRESWQLLLKWLDEVEAASTASADATTAKQEDIKVLLGQHKEFQKRMHIKRPVFEATLRHGRLLRAKALLPTDGQELDEMLRELKERWGALWSWAAERQRKLEERLLFSGRFSDALQTLLDWLYQVEPQLAEETPVAGDRDLVGALMEKHKAFQKELGQRAAAVRTLRCSVRELAQGGGTADTQWLQIQMEELGQRWELVSRLSVSKRDQLEVALRQAKEFRALLQSFLSRLSELEKSVVEEEEEEEEEEEAVAAAAMAGGQSRLKELRQSVRAQQPELEHICALGEEILSACHPDAVGTIQSWVALAKSRFQQLCGRAQRQEQRLGAHAAALAAGQEQLERLSDWVTAAEESLSLRDREPVPEDAGQLEELWCQHTVFMQELSHKQPEVEEVTKSCRRERTSAPGGTAPSLKCPSGQRGASRAFPGPPLVPLEDPEPQRPLLAQLVHRWQRLWLAALDRQRRLQSSQQRLRELEELACFDFGVWRKRYLQWISHRKSRVLDVFRSIDRDQDGRVTQQEFVGRVLASKFPTSLPEMKAVAKIFDTNRDGFIDYYEFISALHPTRDILRQAANVDQIQEEVNRQVAQCNCAMRFQVEQISATRFRFGESEQLRMVRILRSTLMVRVGGGWTALDEFLVKNDPCRVKGRTNTKINEKYLSPGLLGRKGADSQSAPTSKGLSPSCSTSSLSLYSSASVPSSPVPRKAVLRRTRSGDRCLHSRSAGVTEGAGLAFAAGAASPDAESRDRPSSNLAAS
ncbi:microtubule-actin cross-linking factor 1, isoforms 6/7-like isoform 1-T3 [Liasis olivaceus]